MYRKDVRLWEPDAGLMRGSAMARFMGWLEATRGLRHRDYSELWQWSVSEPAACWAALAEFFEIRFHSAPVGVMRLPSEGMIGTVWFEGSTLSYAEHVFRRRTDEWPAILHRTETTPIRSLSWAELERQVASVAAWLRREGVGPGDRVASLLPNIPEAVVAFLAANSVGAVWSSCAPEFGRESILDRFGQITPKVLFAPDGYTYNGREFHRTEAWISLAAELPSLSHLVLTARILPELRVPGTVRWDDLLALDGGTLAFEPVPFDHPLWVLYSSGTTGHPKAITHGTGGILLEHLKALVLHQDVRPGERYAWYSTTGWMMWNYALSSLLAGATLALYDGSPAYPGPDGLWRFARQAELSHFGTGAAFLVSCMKAGLRFGEDEFPLLRTIGSTGSPLPAEAFDWVYRSVKRDVWLISLSGGTDICSAFVGGCPLLPVRRGRIQCRMLGCDLEAYDEQGLPVRDSLGEMVIRRPMPSMPVRFWNDAGDERYRASYFEKFPGVWTHGDWVGIDSEDGMLTIQGRSDATLNRDGVRIGTAEIYGAVETMPELADSLVVGIDRPDGSYHMPLFVVLRPGAEAGPDLEVRIRSTLREHCSPRHVPDEVVVVPEIPYTLSGKKMELPVKRILEGVDPSRVASPDTIRNPQALDVFIQLAATWAG
jgi:acetoacetyl-CoA synthetase